MPGAKVSICIATFNMADVIMETLVNCLAQDYENKELIVYDDCSTDSTQHFLKEFHWIKYIRGEVNKGVGEGFNSAIAAAKGDIIITFCADDLWTDKRAVSDIVEVFQTYPSVGYVTRWYYQFISGVDRRPVRAWRGRDPITLANNPSGLAFRREALIGCSCSNRMFVETTKLAAQVVAKDWDAHIIPWDMVAVRVHGSTSTKSGYWLKRRVSSPVMDWYALGGDMTRDYVSFIQIKNGFTIAAVWEEIWNFVKLRPLNLLHPAFWFFALIALITPRTILRKLPAFYRNRIGRLITREIKRPCDTASA